jgi:hypothetical protein
LFFSVPIFYGQNVTSDLKQTLCADNDCKLLAQYYYNIVALSKVCNVTKAGTEVPNEAALGSLKDFADKASATCPEMKLNPNAGTSTLISAGFVFATMVATAIALAF